MKTILLSKKWNGKFKHLFLLFILLPFYGNATVAEKIFEQEITVPEGITIQTKGLHHPSLNINGTISSTSEEGAYTLRGKGQELVLKIDQRFNIFTWEKNVVKLSVSVVLRTGDANRDAEILNALKMDLKLNSNNSLDIDCLLGIEMVMMRNGWFKANENTLVLQNGKKYKFDYLGISASLSIPQQSNLEIDAFYNEINLGRLDGQLDATLIGSVLSSEYIRTFNGKLNTTQVNISEAETASISAIQSKINILTADVIAIGKLKITFDDLIFDNFRDIGTDLLMNQTSGGRQRNKYSSLNRYVFKDLKSLQIFSSLNDQFEIDQIDELKLMDVAFSDIDVTKLMKYASGNFEYGELNIYGLDAANFGQMEIQSSHGSIRIFGKNQDALSVYVDKSTKSKASYFPDQAKPSSENLKINPIYKFVSREGEKVLLYQKGAVTSEKNSRKIYIICDQCELNLN